MKRTVLGLVAILVLGCPKMIRHDPAVAASAALDFGKAALVEGNPERGYALISEETKKSVTPEKLRDVIVRMHPGARPLSLAATEFEPVPGQEMMQIFLHGQNGSEEFYYRLAMQGTAPSGYKVAGIFRGNGPYPKSSVRQKL